jgi:hypothetical protein
VVFALGGCRFGKGLSRRYLRGFDLLMFDDYPFYTFMRSRGASQAGIREFSSATRHCVNAARRYHKIGPLMVVQGFGHGVADGGLEWRDPSFYEESSVFRDAMKLGAKGILFYADGYADRAVSENVQRIVGRWLPAADRRPLGRAVAGNPIFRAQSTR